MYWVAHAVAILRVQDGVEVGYKSVVVDEGVAVDR
jgi:hypothetical protein